MSNEAKLARALTYIQRSRVWREVNQAERRRVATARKLSRLIHPHPRRRFRTAIAGNPTVTVREHNYSSRSILDRFFGEHSHFSCFRSCPRRSSSQQERTEHRRREQIELGVDRVCHSQTIPPWGQGLCRYLRSAQIRRRRSLFYPGKLRGEVLSLPHVLFAGLTGVPADEGE